MRRLITLVFGNHFLQEGLLLGCAVLLLIVLQSRLLPEAGKILQLVSVLMMMLWIFSVSLRTLLKESPWMVILLVAGFSLRTLYVGNTSYLTRTYDVEAHLEYIRFVAQYWIVPHASLGFEFHQGPLYYFLLAIVLKVTTLVGLVHMEGIHWMQAISLLLSCLTLVAAAWCAFLFFPEKIRQKSLLTYFGLIAFFPGLPFFASRINNDALFQLISFVFLGCLLTWWRNGKTSWLIMTSIVIGIGFLTKANCYLFAPILLICIIFRPSIPSALRYRWILIAGVTVTLIAGWLLVLRYLQNDYVRLMAPGSGLNPALTVSNSLSAYLTFDPLGILANPYASVWTNSVEREYFWVFMFKTALFGEFHYPAAFWLLSRILSLLFMGTLALSMAGIVRTIRSSDQFLIPLLVSLIIILEGAFGYRWLHPAASNQDFRFSILLLPLLAYFSVMATDPHTRLGILAQAWLQTFIIVAFAFMLTLVLTA